MAAWEQIVGSFFSVPPKPKKNNKSPTHKICIGCKQELKITEFYNKSGERQHQYMSRCKVCLKAKRKLERQKYRQLITKRNESQPVATFKFPEDE